MNNQTEILERNGFIQGFPFVSNYRKQTSEISCIIIDTCYVLQKKDKIEDSGIGNIAIKVKKINLPLSEEKIFHNFSSALQYANLNI